MALSLLLRNATKFNAITTASLRSARQTPIKAYTTVFGAQRAALVKPVSLVKSIPNATRTISLTTPKLSAAGSNHTVLWSLERAISLALLGVIPAAFIFPSQALDAIMATSIVLHSHWGIEAMITDYVRPNIVGNVVPKIAHASLLLLSIASLGGLFYLIYNDVGIANGIKKFWAIKGRSSEQ